MTQPVNPSRSAQRSLSPNVAVLGVVSLLMGMSSAMIYGVLPVFLVTVLGASTAAVGLIEGTAEATTSLVKIFSGVVSDWIGTDPADTTVEPAPAVAMVPARRPGWNKFTMPAAIADITTSSYFADALIVWKGNAAFSPSPATTDLIKSTAGVTALTALSANDEVWVKY